MEVFRTITFRVDGQQGTPSQSAAFSGADQGPQVIPADFEAGSSIPDAAKQQVLKGAPELGEALDAARLEHATPEEVAEIAAKYGAQPGDVRAFARGTGILVPPRKGLSLGPLAHEVKHVSQFLAVRNFALRYEAAFQAGLARGLSPADAYRYNAYEIGADLVARSVVRANSP